MKKSSCYLGRIASEDLVNVLVLLGQRAKEKEPLVPTLAGLSEDHTQGKTILKYCPCLAEWAGCPLAFSSA